MLEVNGDSYFDILKRKRLLDVEVNLTYEEERMFLRVRKEFSKTGDRDVDILKLIIEKGLKELDIEASKNDYFELNKEEITKEVEFTPSEKGAGRKLSEEYVNMLEAYKKMLSSASKIIAMEREAKE